MANFANLTFWAYVYPHKSGLSYPFSAIRIFDFFGQIIVPSIDLAKSAFKPYSDSYLNFTEQFY